MQVTLFFRKPSPNFHSIEKLFSAIIRNLPEGMAKAHFAPKSSKGILNRILIALDARKNQGEINHITGDIHFIALALKRKKTILTIHDIGILKNSNLLKRLIIKFLWFYLPAKLVKKITVISEFTKMELLNAICINPEKVVVVQNCYPSVYKNVEIKTKEAKPVILQIGTKPNKNLERLIEAIHGISCKLLIVGKLNINQISLLENKKIDYESYINQSEQEMFEHFKRCDLLVYVSTYEGFGMPVIEANAVGRPVLASDIEPIKSVAGKAALLVNPYFINDIRKGILKLIHDQSICNVLIDNGFENAKKYHPKKIAKEYLAVYESILAEK